MIGAGEKPGLEPACLSGAKLRTAVATGVVEGAQDAGFVADNEDFLGADGDDTVGERFGDVGLAADIDPASIPDCLQVARVFCCVDIA